MCLPVRKSLSTFKLQRIRVHELSDPQPADLWCAAGGSWLLRWTQGGRSHPVSALPFANYINECPVYYVRVAGDDGQLDRGRLGAVLWGHQKQLQ